MSADVTKELLEALKGLLVRAADDEEYGPDHAVTVARSTIARAEAALAEPQPDADGWIPWAGGECPVSDGVNVDVRFRYGKIVLKSLADGFRWNHAPGPMAVDPGVDIVAYRIVSTPDSKPSPLGD